jgi:hypothetical protein
VLVEQIGYPRTLSPALRVAPGATTQQEVRTTLQPIQLPGITVGGRCLDATRLAEEPRLAALWNEARKGVQTRLAFERQYRFTRMWREEAIIRWRLQGDTRQLRQDTSVNEPDSVDVRLQRRREHRRAQGYAQRGRGTLLIDIPQDRDIVDDEFLRDHCLEAATVEEDGAIGMRFRPARPRRGEVDVQGTVWVDGHTFQTRRLEVDHIDGRRVIAETRVVYGDVPVAGSAIRLPVAGTIVLRSPGGMTTLLIRGGTAQITYTYAGFQRDAR